MRLVIRMVVLTILFTLFLTSVVFAQDNQTLTPDEPVQGVFSADNSAEIYTFTGNSGDSIALTISSETPELILTVLLSDSTGAIIGQALKTAGIPVVLEATLATSGSHFLTLAPLPGSTGDYTVLLEVEAGEDISLPEVAPTEEPIETPTQTQETTSRITPEDFAISQVSIVNGVTVELVWNSNDDLNLQVRDPIGGTLFWDSRTTPEGGSFGLDVNGLCEIINTPPNVETASWSGGALPTGSYEIMVYHRQSCEGATPVDFTVNVTVNGVALDPITGTIAPPTTGFATVHLSSFTIDEDGSANIGIDGPYTDTRVLPITPAEIIALPAQPIAAGEVVEGVITNSQYFETYQFEGTAGEVVTIDMQAVNGSLDTLLILLNDQGIIIADNDDVEEVFDTNSRMDSVRLPADGVYTIFASRYGKDVAGTQGVYMLSLLSSNLTDADGNVVNTELTSLNLPSGAVEITLRWNTNADLQLLVRDPFGVAVYDDNRNVASGGQLVATGNIDCTVAEGVPVYHTYWPDGFLRIGSYEIEVWYQSECGDTTPVYFDLFVVVNGTLILRENVNIVFNQRYVTSFDIESSGNVNTYLGGIIGNSQTIPYQSELPSAIALGSGDTVTGSISQNNKFDLYVFEGQAGDVVTIAMTASSQTLDTSLYLIDPLGVEIAANDDIVAGANTNSLIQNITLTQDGTYTIIATHFGGIYGGTVGGYNLNLNVARPAN
jgi:uncharacterized protein YfaP (DUF2135 family)